MAVHNQLAAIRKARGLSAAELSRRVGVIRQTIYAIERGVYIPNTEVSLRLARELEVSVEDLFSLLPRKPPVPKSLHVDVLASARPRAGQAVRLGRVGTHWVGVPVSSLPYYLPDADGVISHPSHSGTKAGLVLLTPDMPSEKALVLAGCDPATGVLARVAEKMAGIEVVTAAASSTQALEWLKRGRVHIAGTHLEDPKTHEFNLPAIRRRFPDEALTVVTFACWEEGLVVAHGNPKGIRRAEDLRRPDVILTNREPGAGSRALLDQILGRAGIPVAEVAGYDTVAPGHLAAAYTVWTGQADCCMATRSAALTFGLDFVAFRSSRYDLVLRKKTLELPAAQALLDVLQRVSLRDKLSKLAGYETSQMGTVLT